MLTEEQINDIISDINNNTGNTANVESQETETAAETQNANEGEAPVGGEVEANTTDENNLNALTSPEFTERFSGAPWFDGCKNTILGIIGAGGISSWTTLLTARLNPAYIYIWDDDAVDSTNMGGQFFRLNDIGIPKTVALESNVRMFCPHNTCIMCYTERYATQLSRNCDIYISGVDSMRSRREIFNILIRTNSAKWYIDGRLSADAFQVICVNMKNQDSILAYERDFLFDDEDADRTICSFKQTSYMAAMIASVITNITVNIINNDCNILEYVIPFYTEYNAATMKFITRQHNEV